LRAQGIHFRRQAPFRGYYLDSVCFKQCLVGVHTLRVWNSDIDTNLDGVMDSILAAAARP